MIDSRLAGEGRQIRRRRQCLDCNERFTTFETAELNLPLWLDGSNAEPHYSRNRIRQEVVPVFEQLRDLTGQVPVERYGMTETLMTLGNPYDGERRAGTVGRPFPGVEVRIVDDEGREVPEVWLSGSHELLRRWRLQQGDQTKIEDITAEYVTLNRAQTTQPKPANVRIYAELQALQDEVSRSLRGAFEQHRTLTTRGGE